MVLVLQIYYCSENRHQAKQKNHVIFLLDTEKRNITGVNKHPFMMKKKTVRKPKELNIL